MRLFSAGAVLALLLMNVTVTPSAAQQRNMVVNFGFEQGFDQFASGDIGKGWTPYVSSGSLSFRDTAAMDPGFTEKIEGITSQTLWSDGSSFTAGFSQTRGVTPGIWYKAWFATAAKIRVGSATRTIGLDPTGGTDPRAATVVWGTAYGGESWATIEKGDAPSVRVQATGNRMTLFTKVDNNGQGGANQTWIDAVWMHEDGGTATQAAPAAPTAVPTSAPAAAAPAPAAAPAAAPASVAPPVSQPAAQAAVIPGNGGTLPPAGQMPGSNGTDDFASGSGWFYSQANGQDAGGKVGFTITNDDSIPFYDYFRRYGGPTVIGYPISHRFMWNGFVSQAFQKVIFQFRPDQGNTVSLVNVFDQVSAAGKDDYFVTVRNIPKSQDWSSDDGKAFPQVVENHQKLLDPYPALKTAYFASPDPVNLQGLPMSVQEYSNVIVVRCQRVVFQQWKVDVPWAKAGQVVVANGGDIAKEAQLLPADSIVPKEPGFKPNPLPVAVTGANPPAAQPPAPPAGQPTAAPAAPTNTPVPAVGNFEYRYDNVSYLPNCGLTRLIIKVLDANGNPVNGVYATAEVGSLRLPSNPTGQPGAYDPGITDIFINTGAVKNSWKVTLWDKKDGGNQLSDSVQIETNDICQGPDAKQIATITFKKK